jgi:hypothetical protein
MQFITNYNFQGNDISFYVEGNVIWFNAGKISLAIGCWSENGLAFEINMGASRHQLKPHSKEITLPEYKRKKTLMISEGGILHLNHMYTHQQYQDFLEWLQVLKRDSIQLKNAITK